MCIILITTLFGLENCIRTHAVQQPTEENVTSSESAQPRANNLKKRIVKMLKTFIYCNNYCCLKEKDPVTVAIYYFFKLIGNKINDLKD